MEIFLAYSGYHRHRGSDCTLLMVTGLVNGEEEILTSQAYRIEIPEPIDIKFGTDRPN